MQDVITIGRRLVPVEQIALIEPFDPVLLQHNGLYLTRFSGSTYNADTAEYQSRAQAVMKAMADGVLTSGDPATYRLAEVATAHRDLEARRTVGSIVLIP